MYLSQVKSLLLKASRIMCNSTLRACADLNNRFSDGTKMVTNENMWEAFVNEITSYTNIGDANINDINTSVSFNTTISVNKKMSKSSYLVTYDDSRTSKYLSEYIEFNLVHNMQYGDSINVMPPYMIYRMLENRTRVDELDISLVDRNIFYFIKYYQGNLNVSISQDNLLALTNLFPNSSLTHSNKTILKCNDKIITCTVK